MAQELLRTLLGSVEELRGVFTRPGFSNMVVVFVGWVLTTGTHAVTQALVATDVARRRHHEAFHRFFSRGTWDPDQLGYLVLKLVLRLIPSGATIRAVVDDTLAQKKGPDVFGIGSHLDAVRSTRRHRIFAFGHCWVVLAVVLPVPFSHRSWALPILFRLYRTKKTTAVEEYRKKTESAREMIDLLVRWVGDRRIELTGDAAYCNDTVTRGLPPSVVLFGAMRPDAVLTAPPPRQKKSGRPRKRGETLPKPTELARDERRPWKKLEADLYGERRTVEYKEYCGQWYRACGIRLLRIIVVRVAEGTIGVRVFFSTDASLSARYILETYAGRWAIEVCFRDLKQLLGFGDSSARKQAAVLRIAPFVGLIYSTLVVWFAQHAHTTLLAAPPIRPWYRHKRGFSFADIIRTAQRVLGPLDVLDPLRHSANLAIPSLTTQPSSEKPVRDPAKLVG